MDPFQIKYGKIPTAALSLASLVSEIMWVAGTLIGLGKNVSTVYATPPVWACVCSAFDLRVLTLVAEQLLITALG